MINLQALKDYISTIAKERMIPQERVWQALEDSLGAALKKEKALKENIVKAKIDLERNTIDFYIVKTVVEDGKETKPERQISLSEAQKIKKDVKIGDEVFIPIEGTQDYSRIAAQVARQVILQRLKEIEKEVTYEEFKAKENDIVSGTIQKVEPRVIYVDLGRVLGTMFISEAIPNEKYRSGLRLRFYVYAVERTPKGVEVYLSRSHPEFLKRLFFVEIPEVAEGIIEI